jgi:hypothetical protein
MVTSIAFCAAARLGVRHGWQRVEVGLEQMLELRPADPPPPFEAAKTCMTQKSTPILLLFKADSATLDFQRRGWA